MSENAKSLQALQGLMNEFFAPTTNNERKREIETILENFSSQRNAWQQCLYFLFHSTNQFVSMYSLTTIETLITKQWHGLMWEEKTKLRSTLYHFAVEQYHNVPPFISNKVIKLVVDIARQDWPHFYPDFFTNILNLIAFESTNSLGLVFLQTASEELAFPWEDLSVSRKEELRRLLIAHVPQIFELLTDILDKTYKEYNKQRVTATPPPSPTHGQPSSTSHNIHSGSLLSSMLATGRNNSDRPSHNICCLTLKALTHLFSWVPVTHIPISLISSIFQIAGQGWNRPQVDASSDGLGCIALGAINELLYRNCVPVSQEDFLLALAHHSAELLRIPGLEGAEDSYHEKLTECIRLIISLHWRRLESNQKFPAIDFLGLVFNYTFNVCSNISHLSSCLEIWNTLTEHIQNSKVAFRYEEAIRSVAVQLSRRIQFRYNSAQLELLDNETADDDGLTEWQRFLQLSIETLARLGDLQPRAILCHVWEPWTNAKPQYFNSQNTIDDQNHRESLRDLSTFTQALGRFNIHFVGESFEAELVNGKEIMRQLVGLAVHASNVHIEGRSRSNDAIEIAAQALAASKAWCEWLALLTQTALKDICNELVIALVMATVPLVVEPHIPPRLAHSAAHLLVTITAVVRPPIFNSMLALPMLTRVHTFTHLKPETHQLVYRAACNSLMLPSPLIADQEWEARHKLLTSIVENSWPNPETGQGNTALARSLAILSDMVSNMSNEASQVKKMLFGVLQPRINETITGFPMCITDAKLSEAILDFFIVVFSGLQHHMGPTFTEHIIQTIMDSFTREHLVQALQDGGGTNAVEKFLHLLQLVMEEPGAGFKRFVPSTIAICLEHIYPLVFESSSPAVKPALFSVLDSILMNKWQYFFKRSVLRPLGPEELRFIEQFIAILQAYGQSLIQPDINLFGQNLRSLEKLNAKWKLYHKTVFKEKLMEGFLSVLIQTLINKSHALLDEDISTAIYNMASVDINAFHEFLTRFLQSADALDNSQRASLRNNFNRDTDQPSFMQNIQRLVNDLRCYRLCNLSLPQGSFSLA